MEAEAIEQRPASRHPLRVGGNREIGGRIAALTPTQLKIMRGVQSGRLNKQIAHDLGIAEATVKAHMTALMRKLNVRNRTQVALTARAFDLNAE